MELTSRIRLGLAKKLANAGYRHKFFRLRTQDDIATQIHAFREHRELTQAALADRCGMKQSAISRIEQADYQSWTLKTLLRVGEALDVNVRVVFEPAEAVIDRLTRLESEEIQTSTGATTTGAVGTNYWSGGATGMLMLTGKILDRRSTPSKMDATDMTNFFMLASSETPSTRLSMHEAGND